MRDHLAIEIVLCCSDLDGWLQLFGWQGGTVWQVITEVSDMLGAAYICSEIANRRGCSTHIG